MFFAPAFNDFSYYPGPWISGETIIEVLPPFAWPGGAGTVTGVNFYAAMTNREMTELFGTMDVFTFGWH